MSEEFLARQSGYLTLMQRNRQRLLSDEQRRREEELDECVHQPLITKMAARLHKESVVETSEKFLQRKQERIEAMRREFEEKEVSLIKEPVISESSRFLAVKRAEKLCSQGVLRPSSSPGQRLYALAQHASRKKSAAIEEQELLKKPVPTNVRPESELVEACNRLHLGAEQRKARLEQARLAHLSAEESALKQLSFSNPDYGYVRPHTSRGKANITLISPFCQAHRDTTKPGNGAEHNISEVEEKSFVISDMSRLIAEQLERRSGISSSARLRMPLEKDRNPALSGENPHGSPHDGSASSGHLGGVVKFEKWREQQLVRHVAKQAKLEEFRRQEDEELTKARQIKTSQEFSGDLFFRKQLDRQMRHEHVLETARAAKEKQELEGLLLQKYKATTGPEARACTRLLHSTAAHEARVAARFKGDA